MKNSKGLKVFIIIAILSVFFGARKIIKDRSKPSFSFDKSFSFFSSTDDDDFYDDDLEDESNDQFKRIFLKNFGNKKEDSGKKHIKTPYVAVIHITGVISEENKTYNQKWLLKKIKKCREDAFNSAILLKIDSPGGTVYESDEAYLALMEYKANTNRPVYAFFGSLAASGGYYIGCSADTIFANRNTLTGSIGVIAGQSLDATGLLDKLGLKMTTITAGRNKNMGNYNAPLTEEQRQIMQSIADEAYEQFTGIVADSRKMDISDVKKLADGRIYTAAQAKDNGLVDKVCTLDIAKKTILMQLLGLETLKASDEEKIKFIDYKYQYEENLMSLLYGASSFIKNPEAEVYNLLGKGSAKCLYLYQ